MPYKDRSLHKDKINKYSREYIAKWRKRNREAYLKYVRKYGRKNRKRIYARLKANPEKYKHFIEYSKKWAREHRGRLNDLAKKETKHLSQQYLVGQLVKDGFTREFIYKSPILISIKKYILKIKRLAA